MIVRTGYLIGQVKPDAQPEFDRALAEDLLPAIAALPGVLNAEIHFARDFEPEAPAIHAAFVIHYENDAAMIAALASPGRQAVREQFGRILPAFDGVVTHINSTVAAGTK